MTTTTPSSTSDQRSRADLIVAAVADDIWTAILETSDDGQVSQEFSLADGYPAIALLFAELAARDRTWEPRMHAVLSAAAGRVQSAPVSGLFSGAMSFAYALRMARIATGGYGSALAKVHSAIAKNVERQLRSGSTQQRIAARGLALMDYDLISGWSGMLRYLLLEPSGDTDLAVLLLTELVGLAHVDRDRPGWAVLEVPSFNSDPADFPYGHANVGLAHGAAGILAVLAVATSKGLVVPGQLKAIETISEWLLGIQLADVAGTSWPPFLSIGSSIAAGTRQHRGWCYGIPGIARALQMAGKAVGRRRWMDAGDAAMRSALARPVSDESAVEPGLCHGWAGTLQAAWRYTLDSADDTIDGLMEGSAASAIDSYEPGSRFGFRTPELSRSGELAWTDDGGFLRGAAGIALALDRYARGAPPTTPWDAAMLLI